MALPVTEILHEGIRLLGVSLAGEETFFVAPELNLGFDVGRCPREVLAVDNIFLSHGHMDHAAGIAYYFAQRIFTDNTPGNLYAPEPLVELIHRLLDVWAEIDGQDVNNHQPPPNIQPAYPGADIRLRRDLLVRPFEVNHPYRRHGRRLVRSLGFAAIEVRQKLLDEYQNLTGPQLVELKNQGVQITRQVEIPLVAYCGDTAPGDFLDLDYVSGAKVLLLECTFVEPDHLVRAKAGSHMHVSYLRDVIPRLKNEKIVLTHLSRRTALVDARQAVQQTLGDELAARVTFLMEHRRRGRRARPDDTEV
jgi:ribonuclease Z